MLQASQNPGLRDKSHYLFRIAHSQVTLEIFIKQYKLF